MWLLTCGHDDNLCIWSARSAIDECENTKERKKRKRKSNDDDETCNKTGLLFNVSYL